MLVVTVLVAVPATARAQRLASEVTADSTIITLALRLVGKAVLIDSVWPGFWSRPEFVLYRPGGVAVLYSTRGARPGYALLQSASLPAALRGKLYFREGRPPEARGRMYPDSPFIPWALNVERTNVPPIERAERLLHESFHRWQLVTFSREKPACVPQWYPRDMTFPAGFRAAIPEELRLLKDAVLASSDDSSRNHARAYLGARMQRLSPAIPLVVYIEQFQEVLEGTARFVGDAGDVMVQNGGLGELPARIAASLDSVISLARNPSVRHDREQSARMYEAGSAIVFLLHRLHVPGWRRRVAEDTPLDVLLAEGVGGADYRKWLASLPSAAASCQPTHGR